MFRRRVCRAIGHRWCSGALLISWPKSDPPEGNHRLECARCGDVIMHWYGHPAPNCGIGLLRHRFSLNLRHWKV